MDRLGHRRVHTCGETHRPARQRQDEDRSQGQAQQVIRDHDDGLAIGATGYTVADAVTDWLAYGLTGRAPSTVEKYGYLCRGHVIADLGARKLRDLTATDVDRWLVSKAKVLSTSTVQRLRECLDRAVGRAMARDKVKRNVVALCGVPKGRSGRPSKSLTLTEAKAILAAAGTSTLNAYIVLSLLVGARTEELRALRWDHVDLHGRPDTNPPIPPSIQVWRSVRDGGDTKTKKSRRTLALPLRAVDALNAYPKTTRVGSSYVFATGVGTALDAANVRRSFRRVVNAAGLDPTAWTPRELRHSFVSLLSDNGMTLEAIAELCGHAGTRVTESVYRHQLRPVLLQGATAMDTIFGPAPTDPGP